MLRSYLDFVRAVSLDRLGRVGVVLTTSGPAACNALTGTMTGFNETPTNLPDDNNFPPSSDKRGIFTDADASFTDLVAEHSARSDLVVLGFTTEPEVTVASFSVTPREVTLGSTIELVAELGELTPWSGRVFRQRESSVATVRRFPRIECAGWPSKASSRRYKNWSTFDIA